MRIVLIVLLIYMTVYATGSVMIWWTGPPRPRRQRPPVPRVLYLAFGLLVAGFLAVRAMTWLWVTSR